MNRSSPSYGYSLIDNSCTGGLTPAHENPTGLWRRMALSGVALLAEHFTVFMVNRPDVTTGNQISLANNASGFADDFMFGIDPDTTFTTAST